MENRMEVPQKTKDRITISSSNPIPRHISRQNSNLKRCTHPYVHSSTIHNSKDTEIAKKWKQPKCPSTEEWIKKTQHIYTMNYCSVTKENKIMPLGATWMYLEIITLSEVSQKEKDKYILLTCEILKKDTNEFIYKTEVDPKA